MSDSTTVRLTRGVPFCPRWRGVASPLRALVLFALVICLACETARAADLFIRLKLTEPASGRYQLSLGGHRHQGPKWSRVVVGGTEVFRAHQDGDQSGTWADYTAEYRGGRSGGIAPRMDRHRFAGARVTYAPGG